MKILTNERILSAFASAALFFGAVSAQDAAAQEAQQGTQTIGSGGGLIFGAEINPDLGNGSVRTFVFNLNTLPDGSLQGFGRVTQAQGVRLSFDITSYDIDENGDLFVAGPVTSFSSPNPDVPDLVGFTAVSAVQDNDGSPDATVLFFIVPPVQEGPGGVLYPFTTLEEIYAFLAIVLPPFVPYGPASLVFSGLISPFIPISAGNYNVDSNAYDPIPN